MDLIRFTWFLFTVIQLVEVSIAKSVNGKVRSATTKEKHKEKVLYGKIYEETKHDVNRAIEDAILEASKKATDMVLQPKVTSKLVDSMTSKIAADVQGSGEEMMKKSLDEKPVAEVKKASKKHHKGAEETKHIKEAAAVVPFHTKAEEDFKPDDLESISVTDLEDDETAIPGNVKDDVKAKAHDTLGKGDKTKHMKKEKEERKEADDELNIVDASEPPTTVSGSDTEDTGEKEDNEAPEGEEDEEMEEKSDLLPADTNEKEAEIKDSAPSPVLPAAPAPTPAKQGNTKKHEEGGQEDLKALLDESINNLVRANSAVEVLLRATNQNPQTQQLGKSSVGAPAACFGSRCNQTLTEAPLFQNALYPYSQCAHGQCNISMSN